MTSEAPTLSPGLEGVPIAESSVSLVDGEAGWLGYRGYAIGDVVDAPFEEIVALLYDGELPDRARVSAITSQLEAGRALTHEQIAIARQSAAITHPMFALQAAVAALGPTSNEFDQQDFDAARGRGITLIGKVGHLVGVVAQAVANRPYDGPRPGESHAAMILRMITGESPSPLHERVMNALLNLQADHSAGNASTFTARVVTSTRAEPEAIVAAGIGALSGPAHGGANEAAIRLFKEIGSPDRARAHVEQMLNVKERIPGFGHRIYHVKDPRSIVIQRLAEEVLERPADRGFYDIALIVEEVASERLSDRGLWPNVDLFSGCVFLALDIPVDFFTPIFAAGRTAGWTAHLIEQLEDGNRIFRPRQVWVGRSPRAYVPIDQR